MLSEFYPELSKEQLLLIKDYASYLREWNEKINLVSRKSINELETDQILPSLGLLKIIKFTKGTKILDVGTGGGLPGIPLAIAFPESQFTLIDSIGKKIFVVENIVKKLKLKNVNYQQIRAEQLQKDFDFVLGRAVSNISNFVLSTKHLVSRSKSKNTFLNGIFYYTGGDLQNDEIMKSISTKNVFCLEKILNSKLLETKKIVFIGRF